MKIPLSEGGTHNRSNLIALCFTEGKLGYPTMIELFSRKPGYHLNIEEGIIPIHIDMEGLRLIS